MRKSNFFLGTKLFYSRGSFYREEDDYFRDLRRRARHFNPKIRRINTRVRALAHYAGYSRTRENLSPDCILRALSSIALSKLAKHTRPRVGGRPARAEPSSLEASTM